MVLKQSIGTRLNSLNELHLIDFNLKNSSFIEQLMMNDELLHLKKLSSLTLNNICLYSFDPKWSKLIKNVSYLIMTGNKIQSFDEDLFTESANLISLDLTNNSIADLPLLFKSLKPIEINLKELKLGGNQIENLILKIENLKSFNFENLELLDLSNNKSTQ
jgi:hypothetical protein